ncbi:MAG: signal peptidase I [Acidobacteria bacterium]|nr:signal peptidase I [Acidobacteriota bacterium]
MSTEEKAVAEEPKPTGPPKSIFREYLESFVVTLIMAIFGMTFVLQAVTVPTGSMQNTILIGDYLLVNKFIFAPGGKPLPFFPQREIQRGDIIVFKFPGFPAELNKSKREKDAAGTPYQTNFVKRVIGLPGDTVEFRNDEVYINGQPIPEHRIIADAPKDRGGMENDQAALIVKSEEPRTADEKYSVYYSESSIEEAKKGKLQPSGSYGVEGKAIKVPDDSYFVMGDSRDHSLDSRYWGVVNRDLIIGRAMFVYWSCDRASGDGVLSCITHPRLSRIGTLIK